MKHIRILALLILLCLLPTAAYAGEGGGENSDIPLSLQACSPADGSPGLAPDSAITLDFNKNVVNLAVKEHNKTCFSVTDSSGSPIGIVVEMGDDQVDREVRRTITVRPAAQWPAGETLTLTISGQLTAKNGTTMEGPVSLTFRTAGESAPEPSPTPTASSAPTATPTAPPSQKPEAEPSASPSAAPESTPSAPPEPSAAPSPTSAAPESSSPAPTPSPVPSDPESDGTPTGDSKDTSTGPASAPLLLSGVCVAVILAAIFVLHRIKQNKKER